MPERWQYPSKAEPVLVPPPPAVPDAGWMPQVPDVITPPVQLTPSEAFVSGQPEDITFLPQDWNVEPADVVRPLPSLVPGDFVLGEPTAIPSFAWFSWPADVIQPSRPLVPSEFVLGAPPIIPSFGWFAWPADVIQPPRPLVTEGTFTLGAEPIIPAFDWFLQETDVVREPIRTLEGLFVLGRVEEVPTVPAFDWFQQGTDVVREPLQTLKGLFVIGRVPTIPAFDWYVAPPDVFYPTPRIDARSSVMVFLPPEVFLDAWYVQYPEWFPPPDSAYPYPSFFWVSPGPEVVTMDKWFSWPEVPVWPRLWLLSEMARPLLVVAAPITDEVAYILQECFVLWEMKQNRLLPDPSGYSYTPGVIAPSGWVQTESNAPWDMSPF